MPFSQKRQLYPPARSSTGAFSALDAFVAESRSFSRAASTQRKYVNEFHRFETWCRTRRLCPLPALPSTVERYCAFVLLNKDDPTPGPVLNVLPAIAKFHELRSLPNPCSEPALKDFVEGVRRRFGKPPVQKEPLTPALVKALLTHFLSSSLNRGSPADWVVGWGIYYLFRISGRYTESSAVQRKHFEFEEDKLVVSINRSKADQRAKGRQVVIVPSDTPFCFVMLTQRYFRRLNRRNQFKFDRPVIPDIDTDGCFDFTRPMPYIKFYGHFRDAIEAVGRDPDKYGLHSAKVGSIVEMADQGADLRDLEARAGHATGSGMAEWYSRKSKTRNAKLDAKLRL